MPSARSADRLDWRLVVLTHAVFWGLCVAAGFPTTYFDDSLIVGPALGLTEFGKLSNIYLSRAFYPGDIYLFYPPTFFWVLAGWIALFGKTSVALAGFWAACGLATSVAAGGLLYRLTRSKAAFVAPPVIVFSCIAYTGYRYEILGFATLLGGLAVVAGGRRLAGCFLLFLTPTIAPTMLAACAIALAAIAWHDRDAGLGRLARDLAIALAAAVAVLVAGVSGAIDALVMTMYDYRSVRIGVGGRDVIAVKQVAAVLIVTGLTFAVQLVLRRDWRDVRVQVPLLVGATLLATMLTHARPGLVVAINLAALTLAVVAAGDLLSARVGRRARAAVPVFLTTGAIALALYNADYAATVAIRPLDSNLARQASVALARVPANKTAVVDVVVMKDSLEFPSNRRIEDSMVRLPWPNITQDMRAVPDDEVWIVSLTTLLPPLVPGAAMPARSSLDQMLLAHGMASLPGQRICVIDAAASRRWTSGRAADLVAATCLAPTR